MFSIVWSFVAAFVNRYTRREPMLAAFRGDCLISIPLFYQDRFIILWLGLFPYICINVFLLICFCSVYGIHLFGRCPRLLDPALDTCPLNWNIISFTVNFHYTYHDHCLS